MAYEPNASIEHFRVVCREIQVVFNLRSLYAVHKYSSTNKNKLNSEVSTV